MLDLALNTLAKMAIKRSSIRQANQGHPDLSAWGLTQKEGELIISGIPASELINRYGSPLLILNEPRLFDDIRSLQKAFSCAPLGSRIHYSYKTNCIPGIIQCIHSHGLGAEVISHYELQIAERLSVPGKNIIFNGVSKSRKGLERAIKLNVFSINADSLEELEILKAIAKERKVKVRVGLRLGLVNNSQFGLDYHGGEASAACKYIFDNLAYFNLSVIHLHTIANVRNPKDHLSFIKNALDFLLHIKRRYGVDVPYLDIGGGYGVPTSQLLSRTAYATYRLLGVLPPRPNWNDYQSMSSYFKEVVQFVSGFCMANRLSMPKLIIEPGRVVVSRAELLLSRVNSIKRKNTGLHYAMTDVGKHSIAYPCDYEYHDILVANKLSSPPLQNYHVVGRICMSADFMVKNKRLPKLEPNDIIAVMDAGAYFSSYSTNFGFPRPAIIKVCNGKSKILRHKETLDHLTSIDTVFEK
jgi:diaminopimelate decarboxylase